MKFFLFFFFPFLIPDKVDAKSIQLSCAVKMQSFFWKTEDWSKDERIRTWELEVSKSKKLLFLKYNQPFAGKNYEIKKKYIILNIDKDYIVAMNENMVHTEDGPTTESLILDLNSKNITTSSQSQNFLSPYSFAIFFGQCHINNYSTNS